MSEAELIFTALAELSTRQIAESFDATGLEENKTAGRRGGRIAKTARLELDGQTGKKVVSGENYLPPSNQKQIKYKRTADVFLRPAFRYEFSSSVNLCAGEHP